MNHEKGLTSAELMKSLSQNFAGEVGRIKKIMRIKLTQTGFIEAFILGHPLN